MRNILLLPLLLLKAKSECLLVSHACSMEHSIKDTFILIFFLSNVFSFASFSTKICPRKDPIQERGGRLVLGGGEEEGGRVYASQKRHMCEAKAYV